MPKNHFQGHSQNKKPLVKISDILGSRTVRVDNTIILFDHICEKANSHLYQINILLQQTGKY